MSSVPVRYYPTDPHVNVVSISPDFYWDKLTPEQSALHIPIMREYEHVAELAFTLLSGAPSDLIRRLKEADQHFRVWLEFKRVSANFKCNRMKIDL